MNQRAEDVLLARIRQLPAERLAQVADFVDFLAAQERRREAIERLQALRDQLPPAEITEGEMQEIVDAVERSARRIGSSASVQAVLDTNIAVAGLLWRGKPYEIFGLTLTGRVLCLRATPCWPSSSACWATRSSPGVSPLCTPLSRSSSPGTARSSRSCPPRQYHQR